MWQAVTVGCVCMYVVWCDGGDWCGCMRCLYACFLLCCVPVACMSDACVVSVCARAFVCMCACVCVCVVTLVAVTVVCLRVHVYVCLWGGEFSVCARVCECCVRVCVSACPAHMSVVASRVHVRPT